MLNKKGIYEVIDTVLDEISGELDARVMVMSQAEGLTRYANSEIHQNVFEDKTQVTITVVDENKRSRISTTVYDEEGLRAAAREAEQNLEFIPPGEEQPDLCKEPQGLTDISYDERLTGEFNVAERARLVKKCLDGLEGGYEAFGKLTYQDTNLAVGNSRGVRRFAAGNTVQFSALVNSTDEGGSSGYAAGMTSSAGELDVTEVFDRAFEKARMNRDRKEIEPGAYTVILEPLAVGNLMTYMSFTGFSAKSVQNKASFLTGKKGERVFDERLNVVDDHTDPNTVSLPFDFEGYPRQKVTLVEDGVAQNLIYDSMSARKDGVKSTGHSVDMPARGGMPLHLVMGGGEESLAEIIAGTDRGLLITRFHYMNVVNPREAVFTGLTRDGVFEIEDGEIVGAVKNMRFTESMLNAFNNIEAISSDRERTPFFFGNYYMPAVKISNFHFTGKTDS